MHGNRKMKGHKTMAEASKAAASKAAPKTATSGEDAEQEQSSAAEPFEDNYEGRHKAAQEAAKAAEGEDK